MSRFWQQQRLQAPQSASDDISPLAGFAIGPRAALQLSGCTLHSRIPLGTLAASMPYWEAAVSWGRLTDVDGTAIHQTGDSLYQQQQQQEGVQVVSVDYTAAAFGSGAGAGASVAGHALYNPSVRLLIAAHAWCFMPLFTAGAWQHDMRIQQACSMLWWHP